MLTRRDFMQLTAAAAALGVTPQGIVRAAARQQLTQADILQFEPLGQVTLLHFTDLHAHLVPLYFREPSVNLGVGGVSGLPPHITGKAFLERFGIDPGTPHAYALTSEDYAALAASYGRVGGLDRLATLVDAVRAERPGRTLLLDGGDTWQGSYTSLKTNGADMVDVMNVLGVDAMTAHWEFTYGTNRVAELAEQLNFAFLAGNVIDTEWEEPVYESTRFFERGGVKVAVIGQAFPYTPVANPRYLIPELSFGIRDAMVQSHVDAARAAGAQLVVLLSHNGFDVDRKLASRVSGIDVILTGHTHDALPVEVKVGNTVLIASGSHGKFLSRLDVRVDGQRMVDYRYRLMPVFADAIEPDAKMAAKIAEVRAPFSSEIERVVGRTESLLYRRGNMNGTFDDLICNALLEERDAQIALSPGFRWGATLLPGQDITIDDIYTQTAITYPNAYRIEMTGAGLKAILEDVADNLFNPDPYYQQGGDMVRVGGMGYRLEAHKSMGERISSMTLLADGAPIESDKTYVVAGWASINEGTEGPPIFDVVARYVERKQVVSVEPNQAIELIG
ncbi:MAG: thiosulfohydrolase SoxB [Gammaproteobacteria bacterium]